MPQSDVCIFDPPQVYTALGSSGLFRNFTAIQDLT